MCYILLIEIGRDLWSIVSAKLLGPLTVRYLLKETLAPVSYRIRKLIADSTRTEKASRHCVHLGSEFHFVGSPQFIFTTKNPFIKKMNMWDRKHSHAPIHAIVLEFHARYCSRPRHVYSKHV